MANKYNMSLVPWKYHVNLSLQSLLEKLISLLALIKIGTSLWTESFAIIRLCGVSNKTELVIFKFNKT